MGLEPAVFYIFLWKASDFWAYWHTEKREGQPRVLSGAKSPYFRLRRSAGCVQEQIHRHNNANAGFGVEE